MAKPLFASRRVLVLLVITALAFMTLDVRDVGPFGPARSVALAATEPIRGFVGDVIRPIGNAWNGAIHYDDLAEENDRLRAEVAELSGRVDRLPDVEADFAALQEATGLEVESNRPQVIARIISDRDTGIERIIEIDVGSADGVEPGMPVVVGAGLAGRVEDVFDDDRSTILLVTDPRFEVGATGVESGQTAIVRGDGVVDALRVELQAQSFPLVTDGERFETASFSDLFPADIPVGTLSFDPDDPDTVAMTPIVDFDRLKFVSIILVEVDS